MPTEDYTVEIFNCITSESTFLEDNFNGFTAGLTKDGKWMRIVGVYIYDVLKKITIHIVIE
jgi:hypothetical protein